MRLSSKFTMSFQSVWDKRHLSLPLCQKSGDLIAFYIKQRKLLSLDPAQLLESQNARKRDFKSHLKDDVVMGKIKK
jgi:hypothetical protein